VLACPVCWLRWGLANVLPRLSSNLHPLNLHLPSSLSHRTQLFREFSIFHAAFFWLSTRNGFLVLKHKMSLPYERLGCWSHTAVAGLPQGQEGLSMASAASACQLPFCEMEVTHAGDTLATPAPSRIDGARVGVQENLVPLGAQDPEKGRTQWAWKSQSSGSQTLTFTDKST
jgi:hypothetical protein